jgi:hypothetical protein
LFGWVLVPRLTPGVTFLRPFQGLVKPPIIHKRALMIEAPAAPYEAASPSPSTHPYL